MPRKRTAMFEDDAGLHVPLRGKDDLVFEEPCSVGNIADMMKAVKVADAKVPAPAEPIPSHLIKAPAAAVEPWNEAARLLDEAMAEQGADAVDATRLTAIIRQVLERAAPVAGESDAERTDRETALRAALDQRKSATEERQRCLVEDKPYVDAFLDCLRIVRPEAELTEDDLYPWVISGGWSTQFFNFMLVPFDGSDVQPSVAVQPPA